MRCGWILGWAVPADWFAAEAARVWPEVEHVCVPAAPDWRARLEACGTEWEWIAQRWSRVGLLAPIWALPAEALCGGRMARTQVRALARWTRRDAEAARTDFYQRAGLVDVHGALEHADTLDWGLTHLETEAADAGLPPGWFAAVGAEDALLDAEELARLEPEVRVIRDAGHEPAGLIRAWARHETAARRPSAGG
jgi:hypothetical protein